MLGLLCQLPALAMFGTVIYWMVTGDREDVVHLSLIAAAWMIGGAVIFGVAAGLGWVVAGFMDDKPPT
jgi:hypothetical protein